MLQYVLYYAEDIKVFSNFLQNKTWLLQPFIGYQKYNVAYETILIFFLKIRRLLSDLFHFMFKNINKWCVALNT